MILKGLINGATSIALFRLGRAEEFQVKPWAAFIRYSKLIETCDSIFKDDYIKAQKLLINKDKEIRPDIKLPVEKYI